MFETSLIVKRTSKLELINFTRHGIVYMGRQSGNKYVAYKFS